MFSRGFHIYCKYLFHRMKFFEGEACIWYIFEQWMEFLSLHCDFFDPFCYCITTERLSVVDELGNIIVKNISMDHRAITKKHHRAITQNTNTKRCQQVLATYNTHYQSTHIHSLACESVLVIFVGAAYCFCHI